MMALIFFSIHTFSPHPEERPLGRVSKDGHERPWPSFETPRKSAAPQDEG
jgi:hypothetical protein